MVSYGRDFVSCRLHDRVQVSGKWKAGVDHWEGLELTQLECTVAPIAAEVVGSMTYDDWLTPFPVGCADEYRQEEDVLLYMILAGGVSHTPGLSRALYASVLRDAKKYGMKQTYDRLEEVRICYMVEIDCDKIAPVIEVTILLTAILDRYHVEAEKVSHQVRGLGLNVRSGKFQMVDLAAPDFPHRSLKEDSAAYQSEVFALLRQAHAQGRNGWRQAILRAASTRLPAIWSQKLVSTANEAEGTKVLAREETADARRDESPADYWLQKGLLMHAQKSEVARDAFQEKCAEAVQQSREAAEGARKQWQAEAAAKAGTKRPPMPMAEPPAPKATVDKAPPAKAVPTGPVYKMPPKGFLEKEKVQRQAESLDQHLRDTLDTQAKSP